MARAKTPISSLPLPLETLIEALVPLLREKLPPESPKQGRAKTYTDLQLLLFHLLRALLGWSTERFRTQNLHLCSCPPVYAGGPLERGCPFPVR